MAKQFRRLIAAGLTLWLSGFVLLFHCQIRAEAVTDSCPLKAVSPHCRKKAAAEESAAHVQRQVPLTADCCAFLPIVFDKARKLESPQKITSAEPPRTTVPPIFGQTVLVRNVTPQTYAARLPDKQSSFIVNRVFRI
jgi:hypothetical protein